ncbi:aromatic ring-opening dioxygenase LigA [Isoptericola jiangsuensis]|uniref:aromatic ring-opening dioxygenase LigA n=1 Tax=Isoptericola jiangsuensis TaxID=548579 RepID=UPI003AAD7FFD
MSSTVTVRPTRGVRGIGMFSIIAGIVLILAGVGVWIVVSTTLSDEEITVSDDANMFAGQHVAGPFTAYAQAEVIDKHALEASGGATYAELDQDDPTRDTVMNASFLRASLFTSVVAFGVCALVIGLGILFLLFGVAFRRLAGGSEVSVEQPTPAAAAPAAAAPAAASSTPARHSVQESTSTAPPVARPTTAPDAATPAPATDSGRPAPAAPADPAPPTTRDDTERPS